MTESIKDVTNFVEEPLSQEATVLINEIKSIQKNVDYKKKWNLQAVRRLSMILVNIKHLKIYLEAFISEIYHENEEERKQDEFNVILSALSRYPQKTRNILR